MSTSKYFTYRPARTSNFAGEGLELFVQWAPDFDDHDIMTPAIEAICIGNERGHRLDYWLESIGAYDSVNAEIVEAILASLQE